MRKIKFMMALALLVFVFSGCGGSADSSDESEESEIDYHEVITNFLTGEWIFDSLHDYTGTITTAATSELKNFESFRMSFRDIEFGSDSQTASGKGKVYYSLTCTPENSQEKILITTYSSSAYKEMSLTRFSDTEWLFADDNDSIYLNIDSEDLEVTITGKKDFENHGENCMYEIKGRFSKISTKAIEDDSILAPEEKEKTIKEILEGTWLFTTGDETDSATATSNTSGDQEILTLRLASDVKLKISSIDLNTTSSTGTVKIDYAQKWTAYNNSRIRLGRNGAFAFSKSNETMKIAKIDSDKWRIEDTKNSNENIIITIMSSDEIITVWTGTTSATLDSISDSYIYEITCSFRK